MLIGVDLAFFWIVLSSMFFGRRYSLVLREVRSILIVRSLEGFHTISLKLSLNHCGTQAELRCWNTTPTMNESAGVSAVSFLNHESRSFLMFSSDIVFINCVSCSFSPLVKRAVVILP